MSEGFGLDQIAHFLASYGIAQHSPVLLFVLSIGKEVADVLRGGMAQFHYLLAEWFVILLTFL